MGSALCSLACPCCAWSVVPRCHSSLPPQGIRENTSHLPLPGAKGTGVGGDSATPWAWWFPALRSQRHSGSLRSPERPGGSRGGLASGSPSLPGHTPTCEGPFRAVGGPSMEVADPGSRPRAPGCSRWAALGLRPLCSGLADCGKLLASFTQAPCADPYPSLSEMPA